MLQVSLIGEAAKSVSRITDEVLFVGKLNSTQFSLLFAPFSVHAFVDTLVKQHEFAAGNAHAQLDVLTSPEIPNSLLGDKFRIGQILANLLSNGKCYFMS